MIVFDTTNASEFADGLRQKHHVHVSQDSLESIFGSFSNIIVARKSSDTFQFEKIRSK